MLPIATASKASRSPQFALTSSRSADPRRLWTTHARGKVINSLTALGLTRFGPSTRRRRAAITRPAQRRAHGLHLHPVDFRARLLRRLLCRVVGDAGASHAAD